MNRFIARILAVGDALLRFRVVSSIPIVAVVGGTGCQGIQSALDPRGPQSERLYTLWNVMLIGGTVIFVLVLAFLSIALITRRRDMDDADHDKRRIWAVTAAGVATVVILVALLFYNVSVSRAITTEPQNPIRIEVVGHQWWWEVTYRDYENASQSARTANEIYIPVGRPVSIELRSRDVIHSFWVPNLHGKIDLIPGRTNRIFLQANEPGVYRGQCAEFCGLQHAKMGFFVVATSVDEFHSWLERQRQPATPPGTGLAARGEEVFLTRQCVLCHSVRGTGAMASAGPDLTHIGSRRSLAAGVMPNNRGNLGGWILDPQHVKPGTQMPATALEADDLEALLHYLEDLK